MSANHDILCSHMGRRIAQQMQAKIMAAQADAKAGAIKVDHGMKTQASNNGGNSKFATQFQDDQELMQTKCGTLTDFDQGLDGKIGHPNPNVEEAMEKEPRPRAWN